MLRSLLSLVLTLACLFFASPALSAAQSPFHLTRFARDRATVQRAFPNLAAGNFEVLEPGVSTRYNCIAHSLGIHSRWVNPRTGPAKNPYLYMDQIYARLGFRRVPRADLGLNPSVKKIALYATVNGGRIREVTHAAVQEADGTWTSKLGQLPLIRHKTPYSLQSASYGPPVAVYVRSRSMKMARIDADEFVRDFSTTPPEFDPQSPKIR